MLGDSSRAGRNRIPQRIAILALAIAFAHFGWAADSVPQELPQQEEQAALRRAEAAGLTIYKHDHEGAVATDALGALGIFKSVYRVSVSKEGERTGQPQELKAPQALTEFGNLEAPHGESETIHVAQPR